MFPTLQSLFDPIVEAVEKTLGEQDAENQVNFKRDLIRGVYLFGSQVYFSKKLRKDDCCSKLKFRSTSTMGCDEDILEYLDDSDFDIILVCDDMVSKNFSEGGLAADLQFKVYFDLTITTFDGMELEVEFEVSLVNTKYFVSFVNYHQPVLLQLICNEELDERFAIYEEETMRLWRREYPKWFLRIPRLKYSFIHELNYSMNKSLRFWNTYVESSKTDESSLKKVKKNICHGYRLLRFAHQMLVNGNVTDFSETNDFYDQVFIKTQNYTSWKEYEEEYQPFYDRLEKQFESVCNTILDSAESLLTSKNSNELAIVSFLRSHPTNDDNLDHTGVVLRSTSFLYDGVTSISKLFSVRVHPSHWSDTFEFSLNPLVHRSENPLLYFKKDSILQCNGLVVRQMEGLEYQVLCLPRPQSLDFREIEKRVGSVEQENINAYLFNDRKDSYYCFKKPLGNNVNMFFVDQSWSIASPDLDYDEWKGRVYLRKSDSAWRDTFWTCFNRLGMKLPSDTRRTFMFAWNITNKTITFTGHIENDSYLEINFMDYDAVGQLCNWKVMERVTTLDLCRSSPLTIKEQNDWLSSLSFNVLDLDPNTFEGYLILLSENSNVDHHKFSSFEMKCPVHHHIKILNLTNKNYPNFEILDIHVINNPPRSLINSDKIDQHILECLVLSNYDISQTIQQVNPLFQQPYQTAKEKYEKLCTDIDSFYNEHVQQYPLAKISSLPLQLSLNQQKIPQKQLKDLMFRFKTFENSHQTAPFQSHLFFQHFVCILQTQTNQKKARVELQTLSKLLKLYSCCTIP